MTKTADNKARGNPDSRAPAVFARRNRETGTLFDIRPHFADAEDTPRLAGQNARILALLRVGSATNRQLAAISLKYTARISEIRDWLQNNTDETIVCHRGAGGLHTYEITSDARLSQRRCDRAGSDSPDAACPRRSVRESAK